MPSRLALWVRDFVLISVCPSVSNHPLRRQPVCLPYLNLLGQNSLQASQCMPGNQAP